MSSIRLEFGDPIPLESTSESQFNSTPLWAYVYRDDLLPGMYEWDVRPCFNSDVLPIGGGMMLVTVDIKWKDGGTSIGCCHLAEDTPDLFQLSAFYHKSCYALGSRDECDAFAQAIGRVSRDLFPARIVSRVRLEGYVDFPAGMLNDEGKIV